MNEQAQRAWSVLMGMARWKRVSTAFFGSLMLVIASPAVAVTATTTFNVTATVVASCAATATDLAFGTYDPAAASDKTATSTISVNCSLSTPYTISLNNGSNFSTTRQMAAGASRLGYQLYRNIGVTQIFGAVANLQSAVGTGTGALQSVTVYGVIPNTQNVAPGSYSDLITLSIDY